MSGKGFDSAKDALAAIGVGSPSSSVTVTQPMQDVVHQPIPSVEDVQEEIKLTYKYVGTGPDGRPLETIILDDVPRMGKTKVLAIAWSPSLKKEVCSMVVPKIESSGNSREEE